MRAAIGNLALGLRHMAIYSRPNDHMNIAFGCTTNQRRCEKNSSQRDVELARKIQKRFFATIGLAKEQISCAEVKESQS
jgi:hypothetical protein